jgi:hypothetical protein
MVTRISGPGVLVVTITEALNITKPSYMALKNKVPNVISRHGTWVTMGEITQKISKLR